MCGIAGVVGAEWTTEQLIAVLNAQKHRGPNNTGYAVFENGAVGLGHNRLSIIDPSDSANQPLSSHRSHHLVFNGEIYNFRSLKSELNDYPYATKTDSEVILAGYDRWGVDCARHFRGMFAFLVWDAQKQELYGARDRLGIKPLYYWQNESQIWFASEIKAFLKAGYVPAMNYRALHDYLKYGYYDHTDETFFQGIKQVPPGSFLTHRNGSLGIFPYWDITDESPGVMSQQELERLLNEVVELHLVSDVPIGLHLTGGLDSSLLAALVKRQIGNNQTMSAYTGVYGHSDYDEGDFARRVSSSLGFAHHQASISSNEFWDMAETTQAIQDEPFGGLPTMVYLPMQIECRRNGTVVLLEGQGGDELFGGYAYYFNELIQDLLQSKEVESAERLIAKRAKCLGVDKQTLAKDVLSRRHSHQDGTIAITNSCLTTEFCAKFQGFEFKRPFKSSFNNARYRDIRFTKIPRVLRFNDRMSMAYGHELRVPLLDHVLLEYSFRIPHVEFFKHGLGKESLREIAAEYIPAEINLASKRPVGSPQREWFRTALKDDLLRLLRDSKLWELGILEKNHALEETKVFLEGKGNNSFQVWQWVNLTLWLNRFF